MTEVQIPGVRFYNPVCGELPGYVVGLCGHRVAESEWRAGFRVCERCTADDYALVEQAVEYLTGQPLSGSLTWRRAAELLADFPDRADLAEAEVQLILNRYPDPDDYEAQVSHR